LQEQKLGFDFNGASLDYSIGEHLIGPRTNTKAHGVINLKHLSKIVAKRWRQASPDTRKKYREIADKDKLRYVRALRGDLNTEVKEVVKNPPLYPKLYQHDPSPPPKFYYADENRFVAMQETWQNVHRSTKLNKLMNKDSLGMKWSENELDFLKLFSMAA